MIVVGRIVWVVVVKNLLFWGPGKMPQNTWNLAQIEPIRFLISGFLISAEAVEGSGIKKVVEASRNTFKIGLRIS